MAKSRSPGPKRSPSRRRRSPLKRSPSSTRKRRNTQSTRRSKSRSRSRSRSRLGLSRRRSDRDVMKKKLAERKRLIREDYGTGCKVMNSKKYTNRPSPPRPANHPSCHDSVYVGNDNRWYTSRPGSNGVYRWVLLY